MCRFDERGGDKRFHDKLEAIAILHSEKQHDYGETVDPFANINASSEFGIPPWLGAMMRLNDKVQRIKTFAKSGTLKNEPVIDSFRDIAIYALISWILYEDEPWLDYLRAVRQALDEREGS